MTLPRFRRHLTVAVLGSGAGGSCTWVGDETTGVLVDGGLSAEESFRRLTRIGLAHVPIDGVLVTHEHVDHVSGIRGVCDALRARTGRFVPAYMTVGTLRGMEPRFRPDAVEEIVPGQSFQVHGLAVDPFSIPHDARDPVSFRVGLEGMWAGVLTDLGRPTALVRDKLSSLSIAVLEFHHDAAMLLRCDLSWPEKQRARSAHGHLSNEQAAGLVRAALSDGSVLSHIALANLSEHGNTPNLARDACERVLEELGRVRSMRLFVAQNGTPLAPMRAASPF